MTTLAKIDTEGLLELIWVAPVAAITVAVSFSMCVYGAARASDSRRSGSTIAAAGFAAMSVVAGLAFAATIVAGVAIIVAKD